MVVAALALWLPIVLSAVFVFVVSCVIHRVFRWWHRDDFCGLPDEDAVVDALRPFNIPRGDYVIPYACSGTEMGDPACQRKREQRPVAFLTVCSAGFGMGRSLLLWFGYCLLVGLFAAYLAGRALGPGADYLEVFRFAGAAAFSGYALALLQNSIWYQRKWGATLRSVLDGFIYSLVTAGTFGWLWPSI